MSRFVTFHVDGKPEDIDVDTVLLIQKPDFGRSGTLLYSCATAGGAVIHVQESIDEVKEKIQKEKSKGGE